MSSDPKYRVCGDPLETEIERHRTTHIGCNPGKV